MDPGRFRAALDRGDAIVLDGGLATQLEAQGHDLSDGLWSARLLADEPEAIVAAHLAYFRAGARVATTASYQATFEGFARRGIADDEAARLMRRSVSLAAEARDRFLAEGDHGTSADQTPPGSSTITPALFVAASIGPYGAMLADGSEYRGRYGLSVDALRDFHRRRLLTLAATDADVLAVETIPEVEEAIAVASLLDELPGAAAWVAFTCADGARIRSGATIEEAISAVVGTPGVLAVGLNCTAPEHVEEAVSRIRTTTGLPIVAYPNSGEGWDASTRSWTGAASGRVDGTAARRWVAAGVRLVGGCCRVTPGQVADIAGSLVRPARGA
jgi:homocysteine S-methyltransferase